MPWPSPAEEELVDVLSLDEYLIKHPDQSYLIKIVGDSMIDAGIHPGDLVIVERGRNPKDKDIIVAEVDDEHPPIIPKSELVVGGVIVAVIRKYK